MRNLTIFAPVLYNLLIKKGRGIWPAEALTTSYMNSVKRCQLHHVQRDR